MPSSWLPRTSLVLGPAILVLMAACGENASGPASCSPAVTFAPAEPRLATGDSLALTASLATSSGCGGVALTWRSSDPATISIDAATGVAHAHQAGSVLLYVTSGASSDAIDSVTAVAYAPLFDRIIFTRQAAYVVGSDASRPLELWTVNASGGDLRKAVDDLHYPEHPRVSPDGKLIVVEDWGELVVTDAGGGARRILDTGTNRAFRPWWSPDGEWILFVGGSSLNPPWQLHKVRADNSERMQLTGTILGTYGGDWSPDGTRIIGTRNNAIGLGPLFTEAVVMDANGVVLNVLSENFPNFRRGPRLVARWPEHSFLRRLLEHHQTDAGDDAVRHARRRAGESGGGLVPGWRPHCLRHRRSLDHEGGRHRRADLAQRWVQQL